MLPVRNLLIQTMMAGVVEATIPFINTDSGKWRVWCGTPISEEYFRVPRGLHGHWCCFLLPSFYRVMFQGGQHPSQVFLFVCVFCFFICLFGLKEQNPTWGSSSSCLWNSSTLPSPLLDTIPAPNGLEKQITLKADKGQSYLPLAVGGKPR